MERRLRGLSYKNCGRTYKLTDAQKNSLPTKLLNFININGIALILSKVAFSDNSEDIPKFGPTLIRPKLNPIGIRDLKKFRSEATFEELCI